MIEGFRATSGSDITSLCLTTMLATSRSMRCDSVTSESTAIVCQSGRVASRFSMHFLRDPGRPIMDRGGTSRQFGNVFRDYLYDERYISEATKVQTVPNRWDVNNMHRHPDHALLREEAAADAPLEEGLQATAFARNQSSVSDGTGLEDEYGSNLFDEVDLTKGPLDKVVLGSATVTKAAVEVSEVQSNSSPNLILTPQSMRTS